MANDCCGILKVVTKDKSVLERLLKILNYDDSEFFISRCRGVDVCGDPEMIDGYWIQDFSVDGAWNCAQFFNVDEDVNSHNTIGYEKDENGREDYTKPIYGTAHLTNLVELAKKLDFGCELFSTEPGCCFCEHLYTSHNGVYVEDWGNYELEYPEGEDGEPDYDAEPEENIGIGDFREYGYADEIYGGFEDDEDVVLDENEKGV